MTARIVWPTEQDVRALQLLALILRRPNSEMFQDTHPVLVIHFGKLLLSTVGGGWVILLRCLAGVTRNENPFGELFECKKDQERRKWRGKERNGAHGFRPNSLYRYVMYVCMYGFTLPPPPPPPPPSLVHGHSTTVTGVSFGLQQRQQQHQQFRGAAEGPRYTPRHIRPKETQRLATRL